MTLPDWMTPAPTRAPTPTRPPTRALTRAHALRVRLGLTHAQMAAYLGVGVPTYRKWEMGTRLPTAAVSRLIDVLGLIETHAPALHARLIAEVKHD